MSKERLSLYFDTDVEIEKKMWEYICKDGRNRKSYNVKKLLESVVENNNFKTEVKEKNLNKDETIVIHTNEYDKIDEDDMPF